MNELSIIVPCVATLERLPLFLDEVARHIMENPSDVDCIVVANEHANDPYAIVAYVRERYPWLRFEMLQREGGGRSFGALARFGIAYSRSRYAVLVSPYGEDDLSIIGIMLQKIRSGAQVVQATRYATADDARNVAFVYRSYQVLYRWLVRLLLGFSITDSTYAFKMFDRAFILALGLTQNGYSICPEITLKALLAGGRVVYVPSRVRPTAEKSDFKLYKEGIGYLWLLLRGAAHRIGILWF